MPAAACARRSRAQAFIGPSGYALHRPETTLLYRLVEQRYPDFRELRAREGRSLPERPLRQGVLRARRVAWSSRPGSWIIPLSLRVAFATLAAPWIPWVAKAGFYRRRTA